jgi:NIMA (never in mitosis gene a)-related kinase
VLEGTMQLAQTAVGTPYYLSPEICQGKPYNHKSDVWSLGCILYELCTLKHAFDAQNLKLLVLKIIRGTYPPIPNIYSPELRALVASMIQKEPRLRPSVNDVLALPLIQQRIGQYLEPEVSGAKSSLGDAKSSLGDAESSLRDAESSLG